MIDLNSKVAIITGGGGGIGARIAEVYAAGGASVCVADRDLSRAKNAAHEIAKQGRPAIACEVNVCEPQSVSAMMTQTITAFNRVDILVNSAGTGIQKAFLETTLEEWEAILAVNLTGTFLVSQAAASEMAKHGWGRIINIASVAGLKGVPGRSAYGASKGGVISLTKVMSVELGPLGITVNAIAPGPVDTALTARMHTVATRQAYLAATPLHRYGTPDEQAAAALFLASEGASYVTGQTLAVDGGASASGPLFPL